MAAPSEVDSSLTTEDIDGISSRRFSTSFRGWDPDEVRVHLVNVAEMVRSLTHRQAELERRLAEAEAAARRADLTQLDPDDVAQVLGEETARVLRAARDSAAEITRKATEQAELLARQAADDAARTRTEADAEAARMRTEAAETASATRAAGEAHVEDLRAAGEAEIAERRAELEAAFAEERQAARDESAGVLAAAEDAATALRGEAEAEAATVRGDAEAYAAQLRGEVEAELAARREREDAERDALSERARRQVDEAEHMRDRVLADLARKRKAARQHLEQLHAARDRLLAAYEVIRATTDQATDELGTVLTQAKRAADEAARRVADEPTASAEEMLAELDLAHLADLPIVSTAEEATPTTTAAPDDAADVHAEEPQDAVGTEVDASDTDENARAVGTGVSEDAAEPVAEGPTDDASEEQAGERRGDVEGGRHRRHARLIKHREHDPLAGESLPDVPMEPIEEAAEFESVRVVPATAEAALAAVARSTPSDVPTDARDAEDADAPGGGPVIERVAGSSEPAAVIPPDGPGRAAEPDGPAEPVEPTAPAATAETTEATGTAEPVPVVGSAEAGPARPAAGGVEEEVTGIFERLRAAQRPAGGQGTEAVAATAASPPTEAARVAEPAGSADSAEAIESAGHDAAGGDDDRLAATFEKRDAAVDEVARRLSKHLKRQLSDQQSALLDALRRSRKVASPEELLGTEEEFAADWSAPAEADLAGASAAGVILAGDCCDGASDHADVDVAEVARDLVAGVAGPLRARLMRALGEDSGDEEADEDAVVSDDLDLAERIRACYREWRGARLTSAVSDACAQAYGLGFRAALPSGIELVWTPGPGAEPCSDCNDNALAGPVALGDRFPTGQFVAPAHPGCRCLALPVTDSGDAAAR